MDFRGIPFGPMPGLCAIADEVSKVHAICVKCGQLASFSHRTVKNDKQVLLGETEEYEPLCRECYQQAIQADQPDNIKYFDSDTVTNSSPEFIISELIREKVLELTDEEVPHSVTCIVDELYEEEKIINIGASIIVDRENLKKIIIGKNGNMIKEIGIRARKDIEEYFGKQVYLDLFVKVIPKWRDKEKFLNMIGYKDFLNK